MTISGGLGGRAKKIFRLAIARHDPPWNTLLIFTLLYDDNVDCTDGDMKIYVGIGMKLWGHSGLKKGENQRKWSVTKNIHGDRENKCFDTVGWATGRASGL